MMQLLIVEILPGFFLANQLFTEKSTSKSTDSPDVDCWYESAIGPLFLSATYTLKMAPYP